MNVNLDFLSDLTLFGLEGYTLLFLLPFPFFVLAFFAFAFNVDGERNVGGFWVMSLFVFLNSFLIVDLVRKLPMPKENLWATGVFTGLATILCITVLISDFDGLFDMCAYIQETIKYLGFWALPVLLVILGSVTLGGLKASEYMNIREAKRKVLAEKHFQRSSEYCQRGLHDAEIKELKKVIRLDVKHVEAHKELGVEYLREKKYGWASAEFKAVVHLDPESVDGYLGLGHVYNAQKERQKAMWEFHRALVRDSDLAHINYHIGRGYQRGGYNEAAIKWFEKCLVTGEDSEWTRKAKQQLEKLRSARKD